MDTIAAPYPIAAVIVLCGVASALGKFGDDVVREFLGTAMLVITTCTPGVWYARSSARAAWVAHGLGVIGTDVACGGPHCNPSVSLAMWALGHLDSGRRFAARTASQVAGALAGFRACAVVAEVMALDHLPGPTFDPRMAPAAAQDEALATAGLCAAILLLSFELPTTSIYAVKMSVLAACIRMLILAFPTAGPAMNPAIGTGWGCAGRAAFGCPGSVEHYACYWAASWLGALAAVVLYAALFGKRVFGRDVVPLGGQKGKLA
mmetsp:Transcript_41411/g.117179  ORF Transcript_41411/g.117179 Transcript_41411/m.117179 type:complete len:263 (+) Transcript_41411:78-866(+)